MNDLIDNMLEIKLFHEDDFLIVAETLTRIGIKSKTENTITQSCHILHKKNKYYLVHFLEMFLLDGRKSTITENDIARRNRIAKLLEDWELFTIINPEKFKEPMSDMGGIKIISHKERNDYKLISKYTIGSSK